MEPTITAVFKKKEDAEDAIAELSVLGVDNIESREEGGDTVVEAKFSEVTGIRNVFEKRNASAIHETMPGRV